MNRTVKEMLSEICVHAETLREYAHEISDGSYELADVMEYIDEMTAEIQNDIAKIKKRLG